jgi:hypothetical protein
MSTLYGIREISGVYVDGAAGDDENELLFLSVWGLDTAIQQLLGSLSLSRHNGGISTLHLIDSHQNRTGNEKSLYWYNIDNIGRLQKLTGRAAKDSLFNGLVHLWLYDKSSIEIDYANRQCLLLRYQTESEEIFSHRLWEAIKTVCTVPLLDEWKPIVEKFYQKKWIKYYLGIRVDAYHLDFSCPDVESSISDWIQQGQLTLPKQKLFFNNISLVK